MLDSLFQVFTEYETQTAVVWRDQVFNYGWLQAQIQFWESYLKDKAIPAKSSIVLEADFSPNAIALFLALMNHGCILVPLSRSVQAQKAKFIEIAQAEFAFQIDESDQVELTRLPYTADHPLYQILRERHHPGLVLFSSGSTGESKAALHDLTGLLEKFKVKRHRRRTIIFLLYDHIGGVNTMLYTLCNGGCLITVPERKPDQVLAAVQKYQAESLPTSPTFINLILLSEAYKIYDLSSLKLVTYGTEPMPENTLRRFHELFPQIELLQTYGLSEVGILRSKSKGSDSLWVKVGGEGFETRVVDGVLQLKAQSAMLGYLNAPSPFTSDGWLNTGDVVEVNGDYLKILGRQSEIINVGGEKVYPAEVESVIQELDNVAEVVVYGEKNPITGNIVCARVHLVHDEDHKAFTLHLKQHCAKYLQRYKVPVKVVFSSEALFSERFKKKRMN